MSTTIAGIFAAVFLPLLADWGFSVSCSNEILGISAPFLLSLPGLVTAYIGRIKQGDVNVFGVRK